MMFTGCYMLSIVRCVVCGACCLVSSNGCWMRFVFGGSCSLCVAVGVCWLLPSGRRCAMSVVRRSSFVAGCMLCVDVCSLLLADVCRVLCVERYLLFVVACRLLLVG